MLMKKLYQDVKLPSKKDKIDHRGSLDYWPTSIKDGSQLVINIGYSGVYLRQDIE